MIEAIEKLEQGETKFIDNNDAEATYNTTPTFEEAWAFRKKRIFR